MLGRHRSGERSEHAVHGLRLHRQHQRVRLCGHARIVPVDANVVLGGESLARTGVRVAGHDLGGGVNARGEQPADHRASHVAGADEADVSRWMHAYLVGLARPSARLERQPLAMRDSSRAGRGPKIAVPTRTRVAPSAIATS